jgi:L-rhamnose mutarotase
VRRVGFCFKVKQDMIPEYKRRHEQVWPEMLQALRETGWKNYSLFMRDDGLLFGYLETDDFRRALDEMATREINLRWQREMAEFFEIEPGRRPDQSMNELEEVFHLD